MIAELAQEPSQWIAPLTSAGIVAVLIKWLIGKFDASMRELLIAMKGVEASNNRQTRALLALTMALDKSSVTKREAGVIAAELERAEKRHESEETQ